MVLICKLQLENFGLQSSLFGSFLYLHISTEHPTFARLENHSVTIQEGWNGDTSINFWPHFVWDEPWLFRKGDRDSSDSLLISLLISVFRCWAVYALAEDNLGTEYIFRTDNLPTFAYLAKRVSSDKVTNARIRARIPRVPALRSWNDFLSHINILARRLSVDIVRPKKILVKDCGIQ